MDNDRERFAMVESATCVRCKLKDVACLWISIDSKFRLDPVCEPCISQLFMCYYRARKEEFSNCSVLEMAEKISEKGFKVEVPWDKACDRKRVEEF